VFNPLLVHFIKLTYSCSQLAEAEAALDRAAKMISALAPGLHDYEVLSFGNEHQQHAADVEASHLFDE
jgi:hypothetical protein